MTLASRLAHFVGWRVRERGRQYSQMGRVEITACGAERVEAVVSGSAAYDVWLARNGEDLQVFCPCPFFSGGEPCKHVWAAILEADQRKALRGPAGDVPNRLVSPVAARERGPEPPPPTWQDTLHHLAASPVPAPPPALIPNGKEILYQLDVPATLKSHLLTVRVMMGRREADGSWQGMAPLGLSRKAVPHLPEPDRTILTLLGLTASDTYGLRSYSVYSTQVPAASPVPPEAAGILLPLISSTERFWARLDKESKLGTPITWDGGPPWEIWLEVLDEADGGCRLAASLRRGEERLEDSVDSGAPPVILDTSGFLLAGDRLALFADAGSRWAALLAPEKALRIPAAQRGELVERLLASPQLPALDLPDSLRFEEVRLAPRPFLRLFPPPWSRSAPRAALSFLYEGRELAAKSPVSGVYQPVERRFLLRDVEAEAQAAARLYDLGFRTEPDAFAQPPMLQLAAHRVSGAVSSLLAEGWAVEAEGRLYRSAGRFRMSISSGVDWFDLDGEADFDGETVPLPEVLAAIRRGARHIPLGDGSLGMLP